MKLGPLRYKSGEIPESYVCGVCGASGCKLWREYQTPMSQQRLYCGPCAIKETRDPSREGTAIRPDGKASWFPTGCTEPVWMDSVGRLCAGIPTEDGTTFWGYTSVPEPALAWWRGLPSYPTDTERG